MSAEEGALNTAEGALDRIMAGGKMATFEGTRMQDNNALALATPSKASAVLGAGGAIILGAGATIMRCGVVGFFATRRESACC